MHSRRLGGTTEVVPFPNPHQSFPSRTHTAETGEGRRRIIAEGTCDPVPRVHSVESGKLRFRLRIEFRCPLKFLLSFFGLTLSLQRLRQMKVGWGVRRDQADSGAKPGDGALEISQAEQPLS